MSTPEQPPRYHWTAGAVALLVIGLLILVPSGLCTAGFGVVALLEAFNNPENSDAATFISEALMFGGPFIVLGAALVYAGLRARTRK